MSYNLQTELCKYLSYTSLEQNDKDTLMTFFSTVQEDFKVSSYDMEKFIKKILEKPSKYFSYYSIFSDMYAYDYQLEVLTNLDFLEGLLTKYNSVKLNLPLDVNNTDSHNLATFLYDKLTKRNRLFGNKIKYNDALKMLKIVTKYLPCRGHAGYLNSNVLHGDKIGARNFDIILDDSYDINNHPSDGLFSCGIKEDILNAKIFKLLIENGKYIKSDFTDVLSLLYFRQDILKLNIIKQLKPELLSLNLTQLIKIIFYGRSLTLEFVIANANDDFNGIVQSSNPYDITLLKLADKEEDREIDYIDDIFNGWSWGNDECERPRVGSRDFTKVFELMTTYSTHALDDLTTKSWLQIIAVEDSDETGKYFIKKDVLLAMLKLDITTKEGIMRTIEAIGDEATWEMLKSSSDHNILKVLIE